jgi:PAS domain S-box-containing protein
LLSDPRERVDYRAFLESIPYAPWELDVPSGRLVYVGPQAVDLLGYPLDEWLDPTFWTQKVLPDDQMALFAARASLVADGERHAIEYRMETADHRVIWVAEAARVVREPGRADRIRGVSSDVTHRKTMEIALADGEERLRGLLQQAPDALIRTDGNGLIVNMNEQAEYLLGYSLEEIAGSSLDHLVPARLRPRMRDHRRAFDRDPQRRSLVDGHSFAITRRDGAEMPVELSMSVVKTSHGRHFFCAARDLTPRKRADAQLRAAESRLRAIAGALPVQVCYVDAERRYRLVNDGYAAWMGSSPLEMEGRMVREVLGETFYAHVSPAIDAALRGEEVRYLADLIVLDGREYLVEIRYVPHVEGEQVAGYFVMIGRAEEGRASDSNGLERRDFRAFGSFRQIPADVRGGG